MWSCDAQLRTLVLKEPEQQSSPSLLTRVILPCVQCYVGKHANVVRSAAVNGNLSAPPQRALLASLHEGLLGVAAYHVAVGLRGLKYPELEGGGRLALDATIHLLEVCSEAPALDAAVASIPWLMPRARASWPCAKFLPRAAK